MKKSLACLLAAALLGASWPCRAADVQLPKIPVRNTLQSAPRSLGPASWQGIKLDFQGKLQTDAFSAAANKNLALTGSEVPAEAAVPAEEAAIQENALPSEQTPKPEPLDKEPAIRGSLEALNQELREEDDPSPKDAAQSQQTLGWFDQRPKAAASGPSPTAIPPDPLPEIALTLPSAYGSSGRTLNAQVVRHHQRESNGLMLRRTLPEGGLLYSWESEGELEFWHKGVLIPVDFVFLSPEGTIREILENIPPTPLKTPWPAVPLYYGQGQHILILYPGQARALGLQVGQGIEGVEAAQPLLEEVRHRGSKVLARWLLQDGESGLERLIQYLKAYPRHQDQFDRVLRILNQKIREARRSKNPQLAGYRQARAGLIRRVMAEKTLENQGMLEGVISLANPILWFRNLSWSDRLYLPLALAFEYPPTYAHEFGHYFLKRIFGLRVRRFHVGLNGSGYVISQRGKASTGLRGALISAAGPVFMGLFGLLIAALGWAVFSYGLGGWQEIRFGIEPTLGAIGKIVLISYLAMLAFFTLLGAIPSGAHDWPDAAQDLGLKKLAYELYWRNNRAGQGAYRYWTAAALKGLSYLLSRGLGRLLWRAEPGPLRLGPRTRLVGGGGPFAAAALDLTGARLATLGPDGTIRLWDSQSGAALEEAPDKETLLALNAGSGTPAPLEVPQREETGRITRTAFHPGGDFMAAGDENGNVYIWARSAPEKPPFHERLEGEILTVQFDASGQVLIAVDKDGNIARL